MLKNKQRYCTRALCAGLLVIAALNACTPTVQVAMPNEPITINLNVKIEHEIRVKVEKELDDIFSSDSDLF
ncbi:MAG: YnbE family lipoprotein [Pseudohongiellaceae bacterium]|nr:YnbE family lipoprotein [Pseudohongiellaceae bacterium]